MTTEDEILKVAPDPVRVARHLIVAAKLLYANAEECAVNHYGEDFATHGLPGWLADCAVDITAAEALGARALAAHLAAGADPVGYADSRSLADMAAGRISCVHVWSPARHGGFQAPLYATPPAPAVKVKAPRCADPNDDSHMVSRFEPTPAPASDDLADRLDAPTPFYGWKDPENYTPVMIPPGPLRTEASARIRSDATTIASLRAEVEKLRRVDQSCRWYWPEGATESENCSDCPQEVVQNVSGWGEPTGEVIAVARGGVVEVSYCAALPPASDADSDDEFWVQEPSIELAAAKIAAELERRAALAPIPAKEG